MRLHWLHTSSLSKLKQQIESLDSMMVLEELRLGVGLTRLLRTRRKSGQASSKFQSFKFSLAMTYALSRENTYVRVTGGLKSFGNKRYINALHIRPIKDPHEVYYHIAETINSSLVLERGAVCNVCPPGIYLNSLDGSHQHLDKTMQAGQGQIETHRLIRLNPIPTLAVWNNTISSHPYKGQL